MRIHAHHFGPDVRWPSIADIRWFGRGVMLRWRGHLVTIALPA